MQAKRTCILLDQNIPYEVTQWLRDYFGDVEVLHTFDLGMALCTDREILAFASREYAVIITYDEDFADQRFFPMGSHNGIVRLRVEPTTAEATCSALKRLFDECKLDLLDGKLAIVQRNRVRIVSVER